jgi:hypothetical protein
MYYIFVTSTPVSGIFGKVWRTRTAQVPPLMALCMVKIQEKPVLNVKKNF